MAYQPVYRAGGANWHLILSAALNQPLNAVLLAGFRRCEMAVIRQENSMLKNKRWMFAVVLVISASLVTIAEAQLKNPFSRRAPANLTLQDVQVKQTDGDWMIMCASFNGEAGLERAQQLVVELRQEHKLDAYIYRHEFNHEDKVMGSGWTEPEERIGLPKPKKWKALSEQNYEKVAVLVGGFATPKDRTAINTLNEIKRLVPRSMQFDSNDGAEISLEQQFRAQGRGPFSAAFLLPNPTLPDEYFAASNYIDDEVKKLNKGVKYSLLKCDRPYTVRIATFGGKKKFNATSMDIQRAQREDASGASREESTLMEGAYKANLLCRALRKKGVEAYEFHDRHESYVCVGSFDWATKKLDSGKDFLNPEMADVIRQYKATPTQTANGTALVPRTIAAFKKYDIAFDTQPLPATVPKVARTAGLGRGLFRR